MNQRIAFKISLLVYKVLHQLASYLVDLISVMPCSSLTLGVTTMVSYSVTFLPISRKLWVIVLFRVPRLNYGTIFLLNPIVSFKSQLKTFLFKKPFNNTLLFLFIYLLHILIKFILCHALLSITYIEFAHYKIKFYHY